eukprot:6210542-Pleurochrysis_carterae.AAC.2
MDPMSSPINNIRSDTALCSARSLRSSAAARLPMVVRGMRWLARMPRPAIRGQLLCAVAAALIAAGVVEELPPAAAAIPLLFAAYLAFEYPPPGAGVGKPAPPLSNTKLIGEDTVQLDNKGTLLPGHVYIVVFWRSSKQCIRALPRLERLWRRCAAVLPKKASMLLVADRGETEAGLAAFLKRWEGQITMSLLLDQAGEAEVEYIHRFDVLSLPHAFVVSPQGTIVWHGNANLKGLIQATEALLSRCVAETDSGTKASAEKISSAGDSAANGQKPTESKKKK